MTDALGSPYVDWSGPPSAAPGPQAYFRERGWVRNLMIGNDVQLAAVVVAAYLLLEVLQGHAAPAELLARDRIATALALLALPLGWLVTGLTPGYGLGPVERIRRYVQSSALVAVTLVVGDLLLLDGAGVRCGLLPMLAALVLLRPAVEFTLRRWLDRRGWWGQPVVVFGATAEGLQLTRSLREDSMLGYVPVGVVDDRLAEEDGRREPLPAVGRIAAVPEVPSSVKLAIIVLPRARVERLNQVVNALPIADVMIVPDLHGFQSLGVSAQDVGGTLGLRVKRNLLLWHCQAFKRFLDLTLGTAVFLCSVPVLALCAVGIKLVDPGPAFFRHERVGQGGGTFAMLKLRTMYVDAEERLVRHLEQNAEARAEWTRFMKLRDDPRVLPGIGRLLRKLSLDELPQVWHVLSGRMSLVGPRPFPPYHVSRYDADFQDLRVVVRPGLTGLWQVVARNNGDVSIQQALDTYYIRNWSPWLDLYILLRTFRAVISSRGAC